jgi:hypothetical protein
MKDEYVYKIYNFSTNHESTYAVKYQLAQMRDLYMSSNYTILAQYVYNMYSNND